MEAWILVVVLVLGVPIALAIWLVVRAIQAGQRIDELTRRLGELELEFVRLRKEKDSVRAAAPAAAPATAQENQPVSEPDRIPFAPPVPPQPAVPPPIPSAAHQRRTTLESLQSAIAPEPETAPFETAREAISKPVSLPPAPSFAAPPLIPAAASMPEAAPIPPIFVAQPGPEPDLELQREAAPPVSPTRPESEPKSAKPRDAGFPPVAEKGSFEMRLGTYWFVRVGAVLVLTGLAFFGNLAYHNFVANLGPGGKVGLLYFASALLLGAGAWWQREKEKPAMRNYAQVLFAGGLAAVYFTTYGAHHIAQLCVIQSSTLDGALLLAWAGFMAWIADRRKFEVLALFAVGLAYYTSVITQVGAFTLYSNLVLTLAAVVFLVRNRWAWLSFASLVATYASYAFWRFFHGGEWRWATPEEGLWFGAYFLMSYWLAFTAAAFLSKHEKLAGPNRAGFITLNNGVFFTLFVLTMLQVNTGGFWKFSLGYGVMLLALVEVSRRIIPAEPFTKNAYLTQGLLLVTLGFISKFAGLQLALVLAVESVVLFVLGTQRRSLILQTGAFLAGALAVAWGLDGVERFDPRGLWLGSALGGLMVLNSVWARWQKVEASQQSFRPVPAYFAALALVIWCFTTWQNTSQASYPLALAAETLVLTASIYLLRVRELTLLGQLLLLAGHCAWQFNLFNHGTPPWWNPALMIGLTLGLGHWWQKQKVILVGTRAPLMFQLALSLLLVLLACAWLGRECAGTTWLALSCLLAVAVTAYAAVTRAWWLAACAQLFLLPGAWLFLQQLGRGEEPRFVALAPIAALGALSFAAVQWFKQKPETGRPVRDPLLGLALAYRWVALAMSLWWVLEYVPHREQIWVLMLIGLGVFAFAGWRRNREALLFGAAFSGLAMLLVWLRGFEPELIFLPNALAILALLGQQQIAKRLPARYHLAAPAHDAVIVIAGLTLWLFASRWVLRGASGFYLTASWSGLALALFACGMALHERMYRWLGLGVLAAALGRVVVFDVWKLETTYRILSFMALGIVLLVLGFIYNKYQETIRQWL